ncbi:MAG TPA: hypothetical protein VMT63_03660 [Bacteroidales bacterium]|nr:hypothetical protein [Bacteroidales bacterium]
MKKFITFALLGLIVFTACKKTQYEPIGPTAVRVLNLSDVAMNIVTVNTFDSTYNYGALAAGDTTDYHIFDRAYVIADISAVINGLKFKTDSAIYTWKNYVGKVKITYRIWISNEANRKLSMELIGYDAPLEKK